MEADMIADDEPRRKAPSPKDLSSLSIEELKDYITALKAEISRAEAVITSKQSHLNSAEAFFKAK